MTPNDLDVLIHYHVSVEPHPHSTSPAVKDTTLRYVKDGVFKERVIPGSAAFTTSQYSLTEKGKAFLQLILATPYPMPTWTDPRTGERIDG
jgi:hypothetical protein